LLAPDELPPDWNRRGQPWRAFFDADQTRAAVLATPQPGLRIAPLGLGGRRSVGDLFTDHKTPVALRAGWPLVQSGDDVVWVCGLAVGHPARVGASTRRVRMLAWRAGAHAEEAHGRSG
jgi:tRNA(Ile)-lysidine synthetase-like protein